MKRHTGALFFVTVIALAGCTYADSTEAPAQTSASSPAAPSRPSNQPRSVEGAFQSQAATTTGTAQIRVTDSGTILDLIDFATEGSEDLRVFLSPGTLSPNANGELGLTSTEMLELGGLKSSKGDQQYEIGSKQWATMSRVRSVVIYDYRARVAHGAANLK